MKIIKKIDFLGSFEKADTEDNQPTEDITAIIYCYDNGLVLLEAEQELINSIGQKRMMETSILFDQKRDPDKVKLQQILDENKFLFNIKDDDWEIIRPSYEGNYIIKGKKRSAIALLHYDNKINWLNLVSG